MKITPEEARRAGGLSSNVQFTDAELALVVSVEELVVAFLEGKGLKWYLAITPLRQELEQLEHFVTIRRS